jgi:hypothetical protein
LLGLLDRVFIRSGAFEVLGWADEDVHFAEAKHGGKYALRPSRKE